MSLNVKVRGVCYRLTELDRLTVNLHAWFVNEVDEGDVDLAHIVGAQLVLVLDPEDQFLGVVTHTHSEKLIPLWAQVVVDHLETRARSAHDFWLLLVFRKFLDKKSALCGPKGIYTVVSKISHGRNTGKKPK